MRVVLRAFVNSSTGSFTSISNPVWYSDGVNSLGGSLRKLWYQMGGTYVQPSIPTESNDPPQLSGNMINFFATTSVAPADGDAAGPNAGPYTATVPKYIGDYLNLVMEVEATDVQGTTGTEPITFAWAEV